jgi:uncharacterized protein (DUF924 family)
MTPREIINYWMAQPEKRLFSVDPDFDTELTDRSLVRAHAQAVAGGLADWADSTDGRWRWCCCSTR